MSEPWYSYKCRVESLRDFGLFLHCKDDANVRFVNNNTNFIEFGQDLHWEFESNYKLEDLITLMVKVDVEEKLDLTVMYETLNYRAVYTGDRVSCDHLKEFIEV